MAWIRGRAIGYSASGHRMTRTARIVQLAWENPVALYELSTYTLRAGKLGKAVALYESERWPALQKYEDKLVQYAPQTGLAAARARGRKGSRRPIPPQRFPCGDHQAPAQGLSTENRSDLQHVGHFQADVFPSIGVV